MVKNFFAYFRTLERVFNKLIKDLPTTVKVRIAERLIDAIIVAVFFVLVIVMIKWSGL